LKEEEVVFQSYLGNETVDCAPDSDSLSATVKIDAGLPWRMIQPGPWGEKIAGGDAVAAGAELEPSDVDMRDPAQVDIWKTVQVLLNKVIYTDSYLRV
jgi:hypothetical protein